MLNLGKMYKNGDGVIKNPTKAKELFEEACNLKYKEACEELKKIKNK